MLAATLRRPFLALALVAVPLPIAAQQAPAAPSTVTQSALVRFTVPRSLEAFAMQRHEPAPDTRTGPQWGSPGYFVPPAFYPLAVPFQAHGPMQFGPRIVPGPDLVPQSVRPPG
jgi:hypothetical protein